MRVLVAGASGLLGRATVRALAARGHDAVGLVRDEAGAAHVRADGGEPLAIGDALADGTLDDAVARAAPDAIVNQLSALPREYAPKTIAPYYERTTALRHDGTRLLLDAARAHGVPRLVAQSIAFVYAPEGDAVKREDAATYGDAPEPLGHAIRGVLAMERLLAGADDVAGVALRYGFTVGAPTHYSRAGNIGVAARAGAYPLIGSGEGVYSFVHLADAAEATALAVERPDVRGVVNVVDDEPAPVRTWLPEMARMLGGPPPPRLSAAEAARTISPVAAMMAERQRGADNARARELLGWRPRRSWRDGFAE